MSKVKGIAVRTTKVIADTERFPLLLYKRILRLHYALPKEMRLIGDRYVKDEFRKHKNVSREQALVFLKEWKEYCTVLSKQLSTHSVAENVIGINLNPALLDNLQDDQLQQLYNLKLEAEKARNDINKTSY